MTARKARKGSIVSVPVDPRSNNGDPEAAAVIVKVDDSDESKTLVNVKVFLDGPGERLVRGLELLSKKPKEGDELPEGPYAYWPAS